MRDKYSNSEKDGGQPDTTLDFMCIGAQKAGTTWLYEMLRRHPQLWLPPLKELHYFDRSQSYSSNNFLLSDRPFERLFSPAKPNREFRQQLRRVLRAAWVNRSSATLLWAVRFGSGVVNDEWYRSLFAGTSLIRGEITPSYTMLDSHDVARVQRLAPQLRVILLLRNPIDRAWSQIRHDWAHGAFHGIDDFDRVCRFIDSPHQTLRSNYLRTLEIWERHFPSHQIFIGFYDEIAEQPAKILSAILQFLGCDPSLGMRMEQLQRRVHVSKEKEMPEAVHRYLAAKYYEDLVALAARFRRYPQHWLTVAKAAGMV
ncbi:MAG: sulfotransferase domain-containing protein [Chthoniobacterales bacterium]|nr:sulfotransferase domain-containing protein [Chthoniobacterales bacterium]